MARPGQRVGVAVASYAGIRFATEFVREGRTDIAGLNSVQWSVLIIALAVTAWLWLRGRAQPEHAQLCGGRAPSGQSRMGDHDAVPQGEQRAYLASLFVMATLLSVAIGLPEALGPFERVFLVTAACATGLSAVLRISPQWFARPLVPSLSALLLLTPPDSVPKKREIIVGGGVWSGAYSVIVGQDEQPFNYTDCEGNTAQGSRMGDVMATRRATTGWFSGGLRQLTSSGLRVTVEGQALAGNDKLQSLGAGELFAPVAQSTSILAGGAALTLEGKSDHLRISVLGGRLSYLGSEKQGITGSVTARTGAESGFFFEGNLAPAQWYVNTGDFSYAGVGYVVSKKGARLVLGGGLGVYLGVHVPMDGFEFDVIGRAPADQSKADNPGPTLSIGMKKAFTIR
jgi:hypothetical protein